MKIRFLRRGLSVFLTCFWVLIPSSVFADHIPFIVPKTTISAGQIISAEQLEKKKFYIKAEAASRYVLNIAQIEGKVSKRLLLPGRAITLSSLGEPKIILKGKTARLLFKTGDLTITALGSPLEDGSVGDWIKLRNIDSGRLVSGIVLADGSVQVGVQ